MANNPSTHWSIKYRELVNSTRGVTAEEPATPVSRKKLKTKMAFQTTLDAVRKNESELSKEKESDKKTVSHSKKTNPSTRV